MGIDIVLAKLIDLQHVSFCSPLCTSPVLVPGGVEPGLDKVHEAGSTLASSAAVPTQF